VSEESDKPSLLANVHDLEAEAAKDGEPRSPLELRLKAAQLRVDALGEKSYPVLVCTECARVTGWISESGQCDSCLRDTQLQHAYADPHGGWVVLDDARPAHKHVEHPHHGPGAVHRLLGGHAARDQAVVGAWLERVDPDTTGPVEPEQGFEVEGAHRDQVVAADGTGTIVRFRTSSHRFVRREWVELESTRIAHDAVLVPAEFSGGLPAEQLVDAWIDYKQAVEEFNASRWSELSAAREQARLDAEARDAALQEQRGAADLLEE
jgi:hypothetical protein